MSEGRGDSIERKRGGQDDTPGRKSLARQGEKMETVGWAEAEGNYIGGMCITQKKRESAWFRKDWGKRGAGQKKGGGTGELTAGKKRACSAHFGRR